MISVLGALWTALQSIGWLAYFLHRLISDTLNINYRLVGALGHLIAGIAKVLYMLLSSVGLALSEAVSYVLITFSGIFSFVVNCFNFVTHCCTLLFEIIYYTVTGVADGLFFVLVMPICACQTIHSWITWIFNTERWLNAVAWCLRTCSSGLCLVGESVWSVILSSGTTFSCWMSTVAMYTCESLKLFCCTTYNSLLSAITVITGAITSVLFEIWSFITQSPYIVFNCFLTVLMNPVHGLLQLCATSYLNLILILLSVLMTILMTMLIFCSRQLTSLLPRFLRLSTGEVIRIHLDNIDMAEFSDDENDHFQRHAADVFGFAEYDEDTEEEEEESNIAESMDEASDDTSFVTDSDIDYSDEESIEVQLPDQPRGPRHGYSTRSKSNVEQLQQHLDHERERSLCVICQDQAKSVLVLPCRHMCMCVDCARTVVSGAHGQRRICPLCRGNIRMVMNVYT